MKKLLVAFTLLISSHIIHAQAYAFFTAGQSYFLLADKVNVRKTASTQGEKLANLPIGTKVKITAVTEQMFSNNGYEAPWCEVEYASNQKGFIWCGFLACTAVPSKTDTALYFAYGPSKLVKPKGEDMRERLTVQIRAFKNQEELDKIEFEALGGIDGDSALVGLGSKGLDGVNDVLNITFSDGFCGGGFGDAVVFWNGKSLMHVYDLIDGFDAPAWYDETLLFPADTNIAKNQMILVQQGGYYDDITGDNVLETDTKAMLIWNGKAIISPEEEK